METLLNEFKLIFCTAGSGNLWADILYKPIPIFCVCDVMNRSVSTKKTQLFIHEPLTAWTERLNARTYHVHLHLIDRPVIFKVDEKPVSLLLQLLGLQQSHGHLEPLIKPLVQFNTVPLKP